MKRHLLAVVLTISVSTPGFGDTSAPPRLIEWRQGEPPNVRKLNAFIESRPAPIVLIYGDVKRIELTVPIRHSAAAKKYGFTGTGPSATGLVDLRNETTVRNVIAGFALCVGCIFGGILIVRRHSKWALGIVAAATIVGVCVALYFPRMASGRNTAPIPVTPATEEMPIDVYLVDARDEIRVTMPKSMKPSWLGERDETPWPSPYYSPPERGWRTPTPRK